jgi:NADPH-dependent curcumin reductase CurA
LRTVYLSLDPTSRNWMKLDPSQTYLPLAVGDVMRGVVVSVVEESRSAALSPGDAVTGLLGWETHSVVPADQVIKVSRDVPLETHLTIFSHIGRAAAMGMLAVGGLKAGDTVVVSAAAGATGSLAAQLASAYGAIVIGIAGGERKCRMLVEEFGLNGAIDYKAEDVSRALARECPSGVDLFFDNVGGEVLDAVLANLAIGARIVVCGAISQYDLPDSASAYGCKNLPLIMFRRARMEGFVVPQFADRIAEFDAILLDLYRRGRLKNRPQFVAGLEQAPVALERLFNGQTDGKLIVQVSEAA